MANVSKTAGNIVGAFLGTALALNVAADDLDRRMDERRKLPDAPAVVDIVPKGESGQVKVNMLRVSGCTQDNKRIKFTFGLALRYDGQKTPELDQQVNAMARGTLAGLDASVDNALKDRTAMDFLNAGPHQKAIADITDKLEQQVDEAAKYLGGKVTRSGDVQVVDAAVIGNCAKPGLDV